MTFIRLVLMMGLIGGGKYMIEKVVSLADVVAGVAVQQEISQIVELVYLDTLDSTAPTPQTFSDYLRRNMVMKIGRGHRDYAKDFWGNFYKLEQTGGKLTVTSAGPDGVFGTADDIVAGLAYPGTPNPNPVVAPMDEFRELKTASLQRSLSVELAAPHKFKNQARTTIKKPTKTFVAAHKPNRYYGSRIPTRRQVVAGHWNTRNSRQVASARAAPRPTIQTQSNINPRLAANIRVAVLWLKYFGRKMGFT